MVPFLVPYPCAFLVPSWCSRCILGVFLIPSSCRSWCLLCLLGALLRLSSKCLLGAFSGPCWCFLGVFLGAFLLSSMCHLGALLLPSWCLLGAFFVTPWCGPGTFLVLLEALLVPSSCLCVCLYACAPRGPPGGLRRHWVWNVNAARPSKYNKKALFWIYPTLRNHSAYNGRL